MAPYVGIAELTPVEAFETSTVQLFSEFNARYQALFNRAKWQLDENAVRSTRLAALKNQTVLADSIALTSISNSALSNEISRSDSLNTSVSQRLALTSDLTPINTLNTRQSAVQTFLNQYTPQPFNASLQQLASLPKVIGRLLGYSNNNWSYWSKASSDVFTTSAAGGSLERGQGANSNVPFTNSTFVATYLNTETSDLRADATVLDGVSLPASGLSIVFGIQPQISALAISEIWNASIGGRMNLGSSHVGYIGSTTRSALWSNETMGFAIGDYTSQGNFNYQMRIKILDGAPTAVWTGGTFQGAGGNESYARMFVLRFSPVQ